MKMGQRKYHILYLFLALIIQANSQPVNTEGQPVNPFSALKNNKTKVDSINKWISQIYKSNPIAAQKYGIENLELARKLNYLNGQKNIAYNLANAFKQCSDFDSAMIFTEAYLRLADQTNDSSAIAKGYLQMSKILIRVYGADTALGYALNANDIFSKLNHAYGQISAANMLGTIYKAYSMYEEAANYYHEVLKNSEKLNFEDGIAAALINIGDLYTLMGEDDLARDYLLRSIPFNKKNNNKKNVALAYTKLGIIEMKHENFDSSMAFYTKSYKINESLKDIVGINNLHINMGNMYLKKKAYKKALENFDYALTVFTFDSYPKGYITAVSSKGETLAKLGLNKKALMLLDSSYRMAKVYGYYGLVVDILDKFHHYYLERQDYKNALAYQSAYYETRDSVLNQKNKAYIARLRMTYEREKDQARILVLSNENLEKDLKIRKRTNQRNIYLFITAGIILIAVFVFLFLRAKSRNDNYISMQRIRQLEKDKKLISAQFLIEGQEEERKRIAKELHDGIGVLLSTAKMQFTSIDGVSPASRPKINNANKLLEMAASEVRKITHNMMPGLLSKYGFFEAVDDLIEQLNESGTIKATLTIDGDDQRFSERKEFMLYRIVQEMINNTIKHAGASEVKLSIKINENTLFLNYSDNGKGFNVEKELGRKSIGLTSIKSRSEYLGGKINMISSPGNGTMFTLKISLN